MADASPPSGPPPRRSAGSIALIAIGLLILIPSGLCTAFFGATSIYDQSLIWIALAYGSVPIALGAGLLVWGVRRYRRR